MPRRRTTRRTGLRLVALLAVAAVLALPGAGARAAGNWWDPSDPATPDSEVDVSGAPFTGTTPAGDVRGTIDDHTHMFAADGFGGSVVCGQPWSDDGVAAALTDCPTHGKDGRRALLENLTNPDRSGPFAPHDVIGWSTFKDWPSPSSFTHQQMYYRWVERAWRGGERVMVVNAVDNRGLCTIVGVLNGPNRYGCNEMNGVRREIADARKLQDYVDARYGGAGKGWFRIVTDPAQAKQVIEDGKLAVVLGVETSEPFGCSQTLTLPRCTKADIDRGLDEMKSLGVSSMFLCHKYDNALCGVRYDSGTQGIIVDVGQFLTTGTWWTPLPCKPGQVPDNPVGVAEVPAQLKPLLPLGAAPPKPVAGANCNPRGLTALGEYALHGMIKRGMMVELDHMSAKAAGRALDVLEAEHYPGALSSHSWMADAYMDRLYALGGFGGQIGGHQVDQFVADWRKAEPLLKKYDVGYGYGMDQNGFADQAEPRGADAPGAVTYPFKSLDGSSTLDRLRTGDRTWDVNTDGVSNYGLVPDWLDEISKVGGPEITDDLLRGAQSYLNTWTAARAATH